MKIVDFNFTGIDKTVRHLTRHYAIPFTTTASSPSQKGLSAIVLLVCSLFYAPVLNAQGSGLGIAAVVNDDVVSMLDLNSRISMAIQSSQMTDSPEARSRISHQILRGLVDEKLKIQETRRAGIKVSQDEIERALKHIADNNKISVQELTNNLMSAGIPISALTSRLEVELAWQRFVGIRLSKKIKVGAEEITDEIARIQSNAGKPEYLLAEIYLPVDTPAQDRTVRTTGERLVLQMQQGVSFSALAKNFSGSPSAAIGGDLGWVQYVNLDPALQRVVSQIKPGTASKPVRALGGYYIILLRDVRTSPGIGGGDALIKLSQFHIPVSNPADSTRIGAQMVAATRGMTSCAQLETLGAQSKSLMSGSLGEMKLSTLPKNMQNVLAELNVGQPSPPIPTGGGLAVMMVCERTDQGTDMEKIRDEIKEKLVENRLNVAAQRKLRDLRRDAFVDIRL